MQVPCTRVLHARDRWWEDGCFCIWRPASRDHQRTQANRFVETEPFPMGKQHFLHLQMPIFFNFRFHGWWVIKIFGSSDQARPLIDSGNLVALADPKLRGKYDKLQLQRLVLTASYCVRQSSIWRPTMSEVCPNERYSLEDNKSIRTANICQVDCSKI